MEPGDRLATLGREVLGADVSLRARREILYVGKVGAATSSVNRRFNADDKNGFFSELTCEAPPSLIAPVRSLGIFHEAVVIVEDCMQAVDAATPQLGTSARMVLRARWRSRPLSLQRSHCAWPRRLASKSGLEPFDRSRCRSLAATRPGIVFGALSTSRVRRMAAASNQNGGGHEGSFSRAARPSPGMGTPVTVPRRLPDTQRGALPSASSVVREPAS